LAQVAVKVPESKVAQLMISGVDDTIKGQQTNAVGTTVPEVSQLEIEEPHHDKLTEQATPFAIAEAQGATEIADAQVEDVAGYPERDLGQEHVEVDQPKQGLEQLSQPEIRDAALETEELQIGLSKVGRSKEPSKEQARKISQDTTLRRSSHAQAKSDDHTLKKTTRMAEIRNLEAPGNKSFVSFSNSRISSNLDKLGISLGRDDNLVRSSTVAIKNIELDRLVVAAKNKKQP
jgi:hypothetical protein